MLIETWGQDTPNWICPGGIGMFIFIYFFILPWIIYANAICTSDPDIMTTSENSVELRNAVGAICFFGGSIYSLSYEIGRFRWKALPENKGRLHTIGLARFCIHPNYLGDLFTYTGWALVVGSSCALTTPVGMFWSFIFIVCPNSDAYLATRYSSEFPTYSERVATLVPGLRNAVVSQVLAWICFCVSGYLGANCAGQCQIKEGLFGSF